MNLFGKLSKHFRIEIDPTLESHGFCDLTTETITIREVNDWLTLFHECSHATLLRGIRPYLGPRYEECIVEFAAMALCERLRLPSKQHHLDAYARLLVGYTVSPVEFFGGLHGQVVAMQARIIVQHLMKILVDKT